MKTFVEDVWESHTGEWEERRRSYTGLKEEGRWEMIIRRRKQFQLDFDGAFPLVQYILFYIMPAASLVSKTCVQKFFVYGNLFNEMQWKIYIVRLSHVGCSAVSAFIYFAWINKRRKRKLDVWWFIVSSKLRNHITLSAHVLTTVLHLQTSLFCSSTLLCSL